MKNEAVVNNILDHIVQQGKNIIKDKLLGREKVPSFVNARVEDFNMESAIQGGYQVTNTMRNNYFSMSKDKQPSNIAQERQASSKAQIQKQQTKSSAHKSPTQLKTKRSNSFSGFKNSKYKSGGFSTENMETKIKEKENQFIKLQEGNGKRIIIERVVQRESMEEDRMRTEKQKAILNQYKEKKAKDLFEKDRYTERENKETQFKQHTSRGTDHTFYYHEGEIYFCRQDNQNTQKSPAQTPYHLENDQEEPQTENIRSRSSHHFRRSQPKIVENNLRPSEHHRIRSARGEAFASAVLKTINLSRISLNETLRNLDDQQFMKRNDLFNNNHARQTTSIPYLLPKSGTVYTELSTNQVVGEARNQSEDKHSCSFRSETTKNPISNRRKSHFEPYLNQDISACNNSSRVESERDKNEEANQKGAKASARPIRTADARSSRQVRSERRPQTTLNKGRITTVNEDLAWVLLK